MDELLGKKTDYGLHDCVEPAIQWYKRIFGNERVFVIQQCQFWLRSRNERVVLNLGGNTKDALVPEVLRGVKRWVT